MSTADGRVHIVRRRSPLSPYAKVYGPMVLDARVSDGAFRTLELLDLLAGADGEGRHGLALIAKLLRAGVRTVERHIGDLEAIKLISVERRRGRTNRIVIEDPEAVYGREAITGFFLTVREAARSAHDTPESDDGGASSGSDTPDKNGGGTPAKNGSTPPPKMAGRADQGEAAVREAAPVGVQPAAAPLGGSSPAAANRSATPHPETTTAPSKHPTPPPSGAPPVSAPTEAPAGAYVCAPKPVLNGATPNSARAGSGIHAHAADAEDAGLTKAGKPRKRGLYDPDRPLAEWRATDAVGYFRLRWGRKWPTEPAPDVLGRDVGAVNGRLAWLDAEKVGRATMREAIDHLFEKWDLGLRERLRWEGSRPGLALIESARLFERLLRDFRGDRPRRHDFYDAVAAARAPDVGWGPRLEARGGTQP